MMPCSRSRQGRRAGAPDGCRASAAARRRHWGEGGEEEEEEDADADAADAALAAPPPRRVGAWESCDRRAAAAWGPVGALGCRDDAILPNRAD
jgi:hypothetical protein